MYGSRLESLLFIMRMWPKKMTVPQFCELIRRHYGIIMPDSEVIRKYVKTLESRKNIRINYGFVENLEAKP